MIKVSNASLGSEYGYFIYPHKRREGLNLQLFRKALQFDKVLMLLLLPGKCSRMVSLMTKSLGKPGNYLSLQGEEYKQHHAYPTDDFV
ncbi:MAG TPA: hypothetical protein VG367_04755 [Mucilaginibacter sp.]|jgi:hypothetical protein|nr:hypothetical protein [Mucilaginibacter sp.]